MARFETGNWVILQDDEPSSLYNFPNDLWSRIAGKVFQVKDYNSGNAEILIDVSSVMYGRGMLWVPSECAVLHEEPRTIYRSLKLEEDMRVERHQKNLRDAYMIEVFSDIKAPPDPPKPSPYDNDNPYYTPRWDDPDYS